MNKKIIAGIIILVILIISLLAFPRINESRIKAEIERANYCEVDSDCVDAGGKCPFGCYAYVNRNEAERISQLIQSFDSKCVYGCLMCPTAVCENNKCREVCE